MAFLISPGHRPIRARHTHRISAPEDIYKPILLIRLELLLRLRLDRVPNDVVLLLDVVPADMAVDPPEHPHPHVVLALDGAPPGAFGDESVNKGHDSLEVEGGSAEGAFV